MPFEFGVQTAAPPLEMKTVLIVSPYYPPGPTACAHRARLLAKHLESFGWRPLILCVDESYLEEQLDHGLTALCSAHAEVVKSRALPVRFFRPFGVGEVTLRSWFHMRNDIKRLMRERSLDAALFTGSHFYSMLHAPMVQKSGVPVVLDFQDPWVSAWGATRPFFSKAGAAHLLAKILEPKAVGAADFITCVSERQIAEMRMQYSGLTADRMAAIPIGGDPEDYAALRTASASECKFALDPSRFNLSYVGTIWPAVIETLRTLIEALAVVRMQRPDVYERLRLNFIGTTENPDASDGCWVRALASAVGVSDAVREEPRRLPYLQALSLQAQSDAILMLGSAQPHYTASKIYGAMMAGRPYLSVYHQLSSSHQILSRAGGGISLGFAGVEGLPFLVGKVADAIVRLATNANTFDRVDPAAYSEYTAAGIAGRYAKIFDSLPIRSKETR